MVIVSTNGDNDRLSRVVIANRDVQFEIIDLGDGKMSIRKLNNLDLSDELIIIPSSANTVIIR